MKKTIVIVIAVVLVVAIGGGVIWACLGSGKTSPEEPKEIDITPLIILNADDMIELEKIAQEKSYEIQISDDKNFFCISDVTVDEQSVNLYFTTDNDGDFVRVDGCYESELPKNTIDNLQMHWSEVYGAVVSFFGLDMVHDRIEFGIYDLEGNELDLSDEQSYKMVLDKSAQYIMEYIDTDGTYWKLSAFINENEKLRVVFFHSYEPELYGVVSMDSAVEGTTQSEED